MKKYVNKLERFGRAFLVPVAILPFVGIFLGIGTGFSSADIIAQFPILDNDILQFILGLFKTVGKATFDNLPLIFAVGLAIGLSKKEKGTAAIAGLVGYITFIYILSYTLGARGMLADPDSLATAGQKMVLGKQVLDINVFGGIIIGVLAYYANKKFIGSKLPEALSFFEGPRLVPLVMIFYSVLAGVAAAYFWPFVAQGITQVSVILSSLGALGAFFYGMLERLLIPFGLHQALNSMLKFTELGGSAEVCGQVYDGYVNMFAAVLDCPGVVITPDMSKYYTGQFIVKIFGLPGAAFAMYKTAYLEHRPKVKGLLISAVIACILTGITEPLEFTFLFVAPFLYLIHAILAGFAFMLAYITDTSAFAIQGAGLINFILFDILNFGKANWYNILWIGPLFFALYYFVFSFVIVKFDLNTPGRGGEEEVKLVSKTEAREKYGIKTSAMQQKEEEAAQNKFATRAPLLIEAYGGADNIEEVDACITRLRINVVDKALVDKERITGELEALGVAEVGNQVQSIYGADAKTYKSYIKELLNMEE